MGRNKDDNRDETNDDYPYFQNHFGELNQLSDISSNSRGNDSGNKPAQQSFKEFTGGSFVFNKNRAQGPFHGNQNT